MDLTRQLLFNIIYSPWIDYNQTKWTWLQFYDNKNNNMYIKNNKKKHQVSFGCQLQWKWSSTSLCMYKYQTAHRMRLFENLTSLHSRNGSLSASSAWEFWILPRHTLNMPTLLRWSNDGLLTFAMFSCRVWECAAIQSISRTLSPVMDKPLACCGDLDLEGILIRENANMKRISDAVEANAT